MRIITTLVSYKTIQWGYFTLFNKTHISTYFVPDSVLSTWHTLTAISHNNSTIWNCYYPHFIYNETKAQEIKWTVQNAQVTESGFTSSDYGLGLCFQPLYCATPLIWKSMYVLQSQTRNIISFYLALLRSLEQQHRQWAEKYNKLYKLGEGAGEVNYWLETLAAPLEDLSSIPSAQVWWLTTTFTSSSW